MSASLRERAFWACTEGEETEVRRQVPIVDALVARAEAQVQRILGLSDPCQVMLVQLAPDATTVEPLGTVVVQLDDVSLVFNRAHGPYGYQTGQVYLAQQDDERWQLVGDPIEDLADLGRLPPGPLCPRRRGSAMGGQAVCASSCTGVVWASRPPVGHSDGAS